MTIEDGEIIITSAGDGVSAETTLTVTGGVISIISGGGSANAQQKTDNMRDCGTSTIPPVTITARAARD